jgi:S1-C subfamily serine protease
VSPGARHAKVVAGLAVVAAALLGSVVTLPVAARDRPVQAQAPARPVADWAATLERIAGSVVSISIDQTRAFDTEWNASSQATGFVVDAERGLILTNRHVVTPGPVTAEATFLNREEVALQPVYRDPVHDFGIFRYDPSKLRFIRPQALPLHPEGAQVGREIRVIGNNAGEQLSILQGTLAKLDRLAPEYGVGKYNDFNTFYLQAASGTSGGSSGSPVIDIEGRVVALNAGGASGAASSFYLPLGRVKRALDLVRAGLPVPRGTLQVVFTYAPYDQLRRLGLDPETEARVRQRFPGDTGMLVVEDVQPGSQADGVLQPGDILLRLNGELVNQFDPVAAVLDDSVGASVRLELSRGGRVAPVELRVDDLHAITPSSYLEFGDAIVHTLSYQQARHFHRPVRGAFVANPGYVLGAAGVPRAAVVTEVDGRAVNGIDDFARELQRLGDGDRAALRLTTLDDPAGSQLRSVRMDRRWFPARRCDRNDASGRWDCLDVAAAASRQAAVAGEGVAGTRFPRQPDPRAQKLAPSLVGVAFSMPYSIGGITERNYLGTGLLVDARRGWVVVDRNTVPVSVGDVRLTFAGTLEVPGRVAYVHPLHNFAVVAFDPRDVGDTPIRAAELDPRPLAPGEDVWVVGLGRDGEVKLRATQLGDVEPLTLPLSRTLQFRDANLDVATLATQAGSDDGVLADRAGRVRGVWASFAYDGGREPQQASRGVGIELIADMVERLRSGRPLHSLEVELAPQPLAQARRLGLDAQWLERLEQGGATPRQVLSVVRLTGGSPAQRLLRQGDLLLEIDGRVVSRFRDVEQAVADHAEVEVTVWREAAARRIRVPTVALTGVDFDRIVQWGGATLHAPHRALLAQRGSAPDGVYVAWFGYGSPATRAGLFPGRRIVEVDGVPTPDLDAFLAAVGGRPDRASVRLRTIGWNNAPELITLRLDQHYWPAYELRRRGDGWERTALE